MAQVMPTRTDAPHYDFQVDLEGTTFKLEFRWNTRAEGWFFRLLDVDDNQILGFERVVLDFPLTSRYRFEALPPGEFFAVDTTASQVEPGLDELGGRVLLLYYPAAELPPAFGV